MLSGGRKKTAILGDGMEAVIAAVYLDAGFKAVEKLILRLWRERINSAEEDARDAKTILQEWAQAHKMPPPEYVEIGRSGPDHAPVFQIEARLSNGVSASASATSKRQAQQIAAKKLLQQVDP
jgi:ribonuclease-3